MNHVEFIEHHIKTKLTGEGFSPAIAQGGANVGVDHYRRCSQASKKGAMFEDCYRLAKAWADKNTTASDKPLKKKQNRTAPTARPGLF
ncbi:hypothetical protein AB4K01_15260 [Serratia fonticola]|uniref:hypothetical protein n=1 Tax=Serratia fonticola TaxID=47917 RepID=UPI0034C63841